MFNNRRNLSCYVQSYTLPGPPGPQGPSGPAGSQGSPGGATGAIGATGPIGATGLVGPTGFQGSTGIGATGFQGATGFIGATGMGAIGFQGSTGIGATGFQGATGFIGATGIGATGFIGSSGIVGPSGPSGIGATGPTGFGATGLVGVTGVTGFIGTTGFIGSTGFTGSTGFIGSTGPLGPTGIIGSTGFAGASGFVGATGPNLSDLIDIGGSVSIVGAQNANKFNVTGPYSNTFIDLNASTLTYTTGPGSSVQLAVASTNCRYFTIAYNERLRVGALCLLLTTYPASYKSPITFFTVNNDNTMTQFTNSLANPTYSANFQPAFTWAGDYLFLFGASGTSNYVLVRYVMKSNGMAGSGYANNTFVTSGTAVSFTATFGSNINGLSLIVSPDQQYLYLGYASFVSIVNVSTMAVLVTTDLSAANFKIVNILALALDGATLYVFGASSIAVANNIYYVTQYDVGNFNLPTPPTFTLTTGINVGVYNIGSFGNFAIINGLIYLALNTFTVAGTAATNIVIFDHALSQIGAQITYLSTEVITINGRGNYLYVSVLNTASGVTSGFVDVYATVNYYQAVATNNIASIGATGQVGYLPSLTPLFKYVVPSGGLAPIYAYPFDQVVLTACNIGTTTQVNLYEYTRPGLSTFDLEINGTLNVNNTDAYKLGGPSWTVPSDRRLKTDILQLNKYAALDRVNRLSLSEWRWKYDMASRDTSMHRGPIAQDLAQIYPEYVKEVSSSMFGQNLPYSQILVTDTGELLFEALASIQALNENVNELKLEIEKLKQNSK
jgi:hypothetical protein